MDKEILKPVDSFTQSLLCPELTDIGTDIAEIGLDSIMDNPLLKEIPIVKCLTAIWHTGISIRERFELKKQLTFIQQVRNGTANKEAIEKRRKAYQNGEKWYYEEMETTAVYLSRHARIEKVKIQAELYLDYINGLIRADKYTECLDVLDSTNIEDVSLLKGMYIEQADFDVHSGNLQEEIKKTNTSFDPIKCGRLYAVGLVSPISRGLSFGATISNNYLITELGKYFCEVIMRCENKQPNT